MIDTRVHLADLRVHLYRADVERPMITSFGRLDSRPALFIEAEDSTATRGWGEVWCNFPALVPEHRAQFITDVVAPLLIDREFREPPEASRAIDRKLGVQAIQAGEEGALSAVSAGIDQALWDVIARRAEEPLWRLLGGRPSVRVYASGIDPVTALETIAREHENGHNAFKVKLGFGDAADAQVVRDVRAGFPAIELMVDANQAWTVRHALDVAEAIRIYDVRWLEEPVRADVSGRIWRELGRLCPVQLAAGENIRSEAGFKQLVQTGALSDIQPDVAKWGGVSGSLELARWAVRTGVAYSPHWAGGGVGLAHSVALLAAVGGRGMAELDVTSNPLRTSLFDPEVDDGSIKLSEEPGIGFIPPLETLAPFSTSWPPGSP